jgi:glycosyltransferase involved in cell wall biosynthesis
LKKILFISHDASITGAPMLLINLARALSLMKDRYSVTFLIKNNSLSLLPQFESLGPTFLAKSLKKKSSIGKIVTKIYLYNSRSPFNIRVIKKALKDVDIVFSNTITNGDILKVIRPIFSGKIYSYIHELEIACHQFTNKSDKEDLLSCTDVFVSPSSTVNVFLNSAFNIDTKKVFFLPYYIPYNNQSFSNKKQLNKKPFFVGNVATRDWRKAPEIFIAVCKAVFKKDINADIFFLWKGENVSILDSLRLNYDIKKSGLVEKVNFIDATDNVYEFYHKLDVLLLTSREDPYPLVMLEAASVGVPCICFAESGGAVDFVTLSRGGSVIEYLDIDGMANQILYYYYNSAQKIEQGQNAKRLLASLHQDPNNIISHFENILKIKVD